MNIQYQGAFLINSIDGELQKSIANQHITFITPKQKDILPAEILGKEFAFLVEGYANDGQNEGYSVQIPDELKQHYLNNAIAHITISVAEGGKPVNTGKLNFKPIEKPFTVTAKMGMFVNGKPIYQQDF